MVEPDLDGLGNNQKLVVWDWRTGEVVRFFFSWQSSLNTTSPRFLNARVANQRFVAQSTLCVSWRDPGSLLCPLEAPTTIYLSLTRCCHRKMQEAGEFYNSPNLPAVDATLPPFNMGIY